MACEVKNIPTDEKYKSLLEQFNGDKIKSLLAYYRKPSEPVDKELAILLGQVRQEGNEITNKLLKEAEGISELEDKSGYLTPKGIFKRVGSLILSFSQRESKTPLVDKDGKELSFEESIATRDALKRWKQAGVSLSDPLNIEGKQYTQGEWIANKVKLLSYGADKGTAIHAYIQSQVEQDPIRAKAALKKAQDIEEKLSQDGPYRKDFSWASKHYEKILANLGVNISKSTAAYLRDKVFSEVKIKNDLLGIAGTIDQLVEHHDDYYSIVDFKTGASFNSKVFTGLMRYGQQEKSIYDTDLDRAKLQVMLYALLIKSENPEARFRNLRVGHIPNETVALSNLLDSQVEVASFLRMIQSFLQDKNEVKGAELPEGIYEQLVKASPDLFNPTEYGAKDIDLSREIIESGKSTETILEQKKAELALIINNNPNDIWYGKKSRENAAQLAHDIIELQKGNVSTAISEDMEISPFTRYFGLYEDTNNPILQVFKQVQDEAKNRKEDIYRKKKDKFNELLQPILDEYLQGSGSLFKLTRGQLGTIKYADMYGFMWKKRTVDDYTYDDFITVEEARKEGYSEDKIRFIEYVGNEFAQFFEGENALMNKTAILESRGDKDVKVTVNELYNKTNSPFKYKGRSFAPRVPITTTEVRQRSGAFSNKYLNHLKRKYLSDFMEKTFEGIEQTGIPIKYLGSPELNASDNYTRNVEIIFDRFMNGMLAKEHFDDVYSLGQGIKQYLFMKDEKGGLFKRTIEFIDDRMMNDLVGRYRKDPQSRKGFIIDKSGARLDIFKTVQTLKRAVSAPIMWVKPINGGINGLFAGMINTRKAIVGSLGEKFLGIDKSVTDYGVADLAFAHKEFMALQLDFIKGSQKDNKLYHLIRLTKYLPDNFDFGTNEKDLISISNKSVREGAMYWFHTMPEEWNAITVLVAQMNNMKLKDGRSLYDAYKVEESTTGNYKELVWDGGLRGYERTGQGDLREIRGLTSLEINKMRRVYQKLQGQYRRDERHPAELYVWGQVILQFKKYLPTILRNLFASKGTDLSLGYYQKTKERKDGEDVYEWVGRLTEGRLRVLGAVLLNLATGNNNNYNWSKLSADQKQGLVDSMFTISTAMTMYLGYLSAFGDTDDDDSLKKLFKRIIDNYSQQYNPEDILRTLNQPPVIISSALNTNKSFSQLFVAASYIALGEEAEAYTQEGDLKGKNEFLKRFPIVTSVNELNKFIENNKTLDDTFFNETR